MASSNGRKSGVLIAVGLVLGHLSGLFAGLEHEVSPGFSRATFDWIHTLPEAPAWKGAATAITEAGKGSDVDRIAAKATCAFLATGYSQTEEHDELAADIKGRVPPEYLAVWGLDAAISNLATKLGAATQSGAAAHIYRQACYGIG